MGGAINYLRKHWDKLTLFLRVARAPLDNNICERALKKAIMHRKNSLFYQTQNGADVGDLYMSLIHTCELNNVNPFDYRKDTTIRWKRSLSSCCHGGSSSPIMVSRQHASMRKTADTPTRIRPASWTACSCPVT